MTTQITERIYNFDEIRFAADLLTLPNRKSRTIDSIEIIPDTKAMVVDLANLVEGTENQLGEEDFFYLLTHPERYQKNPETENLIRKTLDLPETDPAGVLYSFKSVNGTSSAQTAYVRITPLNTSITKPPFFFVGGLHHKFALYLANLTELAKRDGREVIVLDSPSQGASLLAKNASVFSGDLLAGLVSVIHQETSPGDEIDVGGHSLGTVPVRELYVTREEFKEKTGVTIHRFILDAPVPSEEERMMGYVGQGSFAKQVIGGLIINWGDVKPIQLEEFFFNAHNEKDREWLIKVVQKENYFSTNLLGATSVYLKSYLNPVLDQLGRDPALRYILHRQDQLFELKNPKEWEGRRGIYLSPGDHSEPAGREVNDAYVTTLQKALNDSLENQPNLEMGTLYRHVRNDSSIRIYADSLGPVGLDLRIQQTVGILPMGVIGLEAYFGSGFLGGYDISEKIPFLISSTRAGLAVKSSHLPIRAKAGGFLDIPLIAREGKPGTPKLGLSGCLEINMEEAVLVDFCYNHPLSNLWSSSSDKRDSFFFNFGLPIP